LKIHDASIPSLSSFAAVALVETLTRLEIHEVQIKPPNDVFLSGCKVAGILVETRTGKNPFAVVGIGLNVNQRKEDFPPELQHRATSLFLASGHFWNRNMIAQQLLQSLGHQESLLRKNPSALLARCSSLLISSSSR
jgi:BirA family biotin operon repressor/biotin-[acetyl-CoA-carboxylase] ligase